MEKKNIDWSNIGFGYMPTDYRYVSMYQNGSWDEGVLTSDPNITLNECACVLQYAQTCFEGLKAYTTEDGHIVTFRPDLNGERMENSAKGLEMPPFPKERFVDAITKVVEANAAFVPPYGSGATLYIRPYMFGYDSIIGVKPANIYQFRVFCTPVGPYFKGGAKPITIRVSDFDRAAPHGTGHIKAGLNYAMSLHAIVDAHKNGFDENIYLDPQTRTKIEETGGANVIFITKDGKLVIFHDASVERTSNGTGFIKNMTYDELLSLDIGAWKSPEFAGQHIWTFGQLLDFCKETKMLLNMELKNYEVFYENLEQWVIDEICKRQMQEQVFVSSFNHISMQHFKELCPDIETGLLYDKPYLDMEHYVQRSNADNMHPRYMLLQYQPELMELFHGRGMKVNTWTVNDEENMKDMIARGVDCIISNHPDVLCRVADDVCD